MNSLSWFLYLADVATGIPLVLLLCVLALIGVLTFIGCGERDGGISPDAHEGPNERWKRGYALHKFVLFVLVPIAIVTALILAIVPSKQTFYLIAGSELGEQVIATPEAREVFNDIKTIIKQQIKGATENGN